MRVAVLLGLLVFAVPLAALGLRLRPSPSRRRRWPTAAERPAEPAAAARWGAADRESLAKLREVTLDQTDRVLGELAACETRAGAAHGRGAQPRLPPLRDAGAGVDERLRARPTAACCPTSPAPRGPTEALPRAGAAALGHVEPTSRSRRNTTLRGGLDLPWAELRAASRAIRAMARETRSLARKPGWAKTCRPRPPAPRADGARPPRAA